MLEDKEKTTGSTSSNFSCHLLLKKQTNGKNRKEGSKGERKGKKNPQNPQQNSHSRRSREKKITSGLHFRNCFKLNRKS